MNIFINEQKIDFKLENETVLFEVIEGLNTWAKQSFYHIQEILFDGQAYFDNEAVNRNRPVTSVSELTIKVKNRFEIHEDNLQLLYQYISLFLKSLEGDNQKLLAELQKDAPTITKLLAEFLEEKPNAENTVSVSLLTNIEKLKPEQVKTDDELFITLVRQLSGLVIILNERISELGDPLGELKKTISALKLSQQEINDISVYLQTGKDKEALNCIIQFSELSQKTLRLYPILSNGNLADFDTMTVDGKTFSEYYLDLNGILTELLEAFNANDSVLVGDLLEYEIAPRLESLIEFLGEILKENQQ